MSINLAKDPTLKTLLIQGELQNRGLYHGILDNDWGKETNDAYQEFLKSILGNKAPSNLIQDSPLYTSAALQDSRVAEIRNTAELIKENRSRYEVVEKETGVPWWFIGVLHYREASLSFKTHLHNGDSLSARTKNVPKGYPKTGSPPFTWEYSAVDALKYDKLTGLEWSSMQKALDRAERFNGVGYRSRGLPSPYVWAATSVQKIGKFVEDGKFSATTWDKQLGVAAIWKALGI